ncbi:uracil phosphoribosyltransferase [Vulcanococcus sp.]|jgi:uracil phosphoribosyltransferase|uniref:uracil phosphoribosyltransferase n=1 Tax=Vulcanococcus sp. TaxID=2856995 RepID=UPI0037DA70F0
MSKTLRVVVPPHPLIGHWLTLLRDRETPQALFNTAMAELGRWLTYEAMRDWIPYQRVQVQTPLASTEGTVVDGSVPMLAVPLLRGGLTLWEGARPVVPSAAVAHVGVSYGDGTAPAALWCNTLPETIPARAGVLVFAPQVARGDSLLRVLEQLEHRGVGGQRLRVITALAASPGLKTLGERYEDLTIYTGCIDAELDGEGRILPGIGDVEQRLYGLSQTNFVG